MKTKKVLLGLFVGVMALVMSCPATQAQSTSKIVEVGPDNIGGRVTSLVIDERDDAHNTIFAGASNGGLYVRSDKTEYAKYSEIWNKVPCKIDGKEVTLPISCMIQLPNKNLLIGTGESAFGKGSKFGHIASKGKGLVIYNPNTGVFTSIAATVPANQESEWANINKIAYYVDGNTTYVFAATKGGLYRWAIESEEDWSNAPTKIATATEGEIYDIAIVKAQNLVYFSGKGKLYRMTTIDATSALDVTTLLDTEQNAIFKNAMRIKLAVSDINPDYLYAMVFNASGAFKGLYLTSNQSTFTKLTTNTVEPFAYDLPSTCGAICIDAENSKRIYIGGSSLLAGQGYVEGGIYQWTDASYNEIDFGSTNFMDNIFSSNYYVHSGINQIIQTYRYNEETEESEYVFYIATNGGVFVGDANFATFENINRGLNNVQINGVAVATDGSVLAGADYNANVFIESRHGHDINDATEGEGIRKPSWYDTTGSGMNHYANVIWQGNGGQVAVSRFQQYSPDTRRVLFLSGEKGAYARAYNDYMDYDNTQTWTINHNFIPDATTNGFDVSQMRLWESENMSGISTVQQSIDTNDVIQRNGVTMRVGKYGSKLEGDVCNGLLKVGDSIMVNNVATAYYPFWHVMTKRDTVTHSGYKITVDNPIQSHLFITAKDSSSMNGVISVRQNIMMCWTPSDFTHVYNSTDYFDKKESVLNWSSVFTVVQDDTKDITTFNVSPDGNTLLGVVANRKNDSCYIVCVKGFNTNVDYSKSIYNIEDQLKFSEPISRPSSCKLTGDTLPYNGGIYFPRHISDIFFINNDKAVVVFEGHDIDEANVMLISGIESGSYTSVDKSIPGRMAAYSVLVAKNGEVLVGTEDGLYRCTASSFNGSTPNWVADDRFNGVPVTSMTQQVNDMKLIRVTKHDGINTNSYIFPRTKYYGAIYIGTYGAGIYMDSTYVENHDNEIVDPTDYVGIKPVLSSNGANTIKMYPNPAVDNANMELYVSKKGNATVKVYDLNGRVVASENLGNLEEGLYIHKLDVSALNRGMYLVNMTIGGETSAAKLIVR